jgi:hypothetical protein
MKQNDRQGVVVDDYMLRGGWLLNKMSDASSLCQIINKRNAPIPQ